MKHLLTHADETEVERSCQEKYKQMNVTFDKKPMELFLLFYKWHAKYSFTNKLKILLYWKWQFIISWQLGSLPRSIISVRQMTLEWIRLCWRVTRARHGVCVATRQGHRLTGFEQTEEHSWSSWDVRHVFIQGCESHACCKLLVSLRVTCPVCPLSSLP